MWLPESGHCVPGASSQDGIMLFRRRAAQSPPRFMARFTTRVQLDGNPKEDDYTKLHRAMKQKGFSRFVTTTEKTFRLPHAEYNRETDRSTEQVRDDAKEAAESV